MNKKEILNKIYDIEYHDKSSMIKSDIFYLNEKEFKKLQKHLFSDSLYGVEIDDDGLYRVVKEVENPEYDTIILNNLIFKLVSREEKINRII